MRVYKDKIVRFFKMDKVSYRRGKRKTDKFMRLRMQNYRHFQGFGKIGDIIQVVKAR